MANLKKQSQSQVINSERGIFMSTQAQTKANQQNAQKSTGPRTAEGKAAVAQNAVKHGLFAVQEVISTENQAEFDLLREQLSAELA
ncbi:MAG: hypothetical protein ACYTAO_17790, partial [Planctomycetota bacterium]